MNTSRAAAVATLIGAFASFSAPAALSAQLAHDPAVQEALAVADTWIEAQMAYEQVPAASVAVVHDQELVWSKAYGLAHPDRGIGATPQTLYSICSISKLFTAVAVMQLRDQGLLDLRDGVGDLLPWYAVEQRYEGSPPVTVQGILTHSSGLPRESAHPYWTGPDFPFPTENEIVDGLRRQETLYPAREYFQYSNLGLTLAGEIVEELSGLDYDTYVRQNVLEPLGMSNTFTDIPAEHRGQRFATGYSAPTRAGKREEVAFFQARGIAPAAGYASTAEDLAKFASWQFRLTGDRAEVLHAHTLDEMQRVHYVDPSFNTFWGLGFSISRRNDKTFVGHGGSCPGFRSQLTMQRDEKIATVFMANAMVSAGKFTNGVYDLVSEAIRAAADEDEEPPEAPADESGPPVELEDFVGTYSEQPWGSESAVVLWKDGLGIMSLPTDNPVRAITRLRHVEGDVFYRVRPDDERGEDIIFQRDARGRVISYSQHGNFSPRVR